MAARRIIIVALVFLGITARIDAQTTTTQKTAGANLPVETTNSITGEVVSVDGNWLVVRLQPGGRYQFFNIPPGRQFVIDGQTKMISDLKPGVVLTATMVTYSQTVTERTTTVTNGTVWYASGNYVTVTLENGENRAYTVPPDPQFTVEAHPAPVSARS